MAVVKKCTTTLKGLAGVYSQYSSGAIKEALANTGPRWFIQERAELRMGADREGRCSLKEPVKPDIPRRRG